MKDKQAIHKMGYMDINGQSMELYLCCFCEKLPDFELIKKCKYFSLLSDIQCPFFELTEDQAKRIELLLSAKYKKES